MAKVDDPNGSANGTTDGVPSGVAAPPASETPPVQASAGPAAKPPGSEDTPEIRLRVEYPQASDFVFDYHENIRRGETFILTQRGIPASTHLLVEFGFPGLYDPVVLGAVVRWVREGDEPGVGVAFDVLPEAEQERLNRIISQIGDGDDRLVARTVRMLIVDDNIHVAKLLQDGLSWTASREWEGRVRFEFSHARDGSEALGVLSQERFDIVILDVYMPVMDGLTLIESIRGRPDLVDLPILVMSAGGGEVESQARAKGANDFVTKPMRLQEVLRSLRPMLALA